MSEEEEKEGGRKYTPEQGKSNFASSICIGIVCFLFPSSLFRLRKE